MYIFKRITCILFFALTALSSKAQDWSQMQRIVTSEKEMAQRFGSAVSISGDYAIVGSSQDNDPLLGSDSFDVGSVYIYKRAGNSWIEVQKLVASDRTGLGYFGAAVDIQGNYAIVGASTGSDPSGANAKDGAGCAYIFRNDSGTWVQIQKIVASDRRKFDFFGRSVVISDSTVIVGSLQHDFNSFGTDSISNAGAAYVFKNIGGSWLQIQKLVAPFREEREQFGNVVDISGDFAIVASHLNNSDSNNMNPMVYSGAVYVYKNNNNNWTLIKKLVAKDRAITGYFGVSAAISGDNIIVGSMGNSLGPSGESIPFEAGAVYFFKNIGGEWNQTQKLISSDGEYRNQFGYSVGIDGDYAIAGTIQERKDEYGLNSLEAAGATYLLQNSSGKWYEIQKIVPSDREKGDRFGISAISGRYALVGAFMKNDILINNITMGENGVAYFFENPTGLGFTPQDIPKSIVLYPNPNNGVLFCNLGKEYEEIKIEVLDIYGNCILLKSFSQSQNFNFEFDAAPGLYLLVATYGQQKQVIKLIRE